MSTTRDGVAAGSVPLDRWPGAERRDPPRSDRHYLMLRPLADALSAEIERLLSARRGLRVLDIGCGAKPYFPMFAPYAGEYVGIDAVPGPSVDVLGTVEELPFPDSCFDVVLCTQVLEHVEEPARATAEIARVLRPDGVALLSTHGVFLYHPDPGDYWRWTGAGLERLFRTTGDWREVTITPNWEAVACIGYLICQYVDEVGKRLGSERLRRAMLWTINTVARAVDKRFPPNARGANAGSLSSNYLVSAQR